MLKAAGTNGVLGSIEVRGPWASTARDGGRGDSGEPPIWGRPFAPRAAKPMPKAAFFSTFRALSGCSTRNQKPAGLPRSFGLQNWARTNGEGERAPLLPTAAVDGKSLRAAAWLRHSGRPDGEKVIEFRLIFAFFTLAQLAAFFAWDFADNPPGGTRRSSAG